MDNECLTNKFSSLDKRIRSFAQGYRQNLAILGDDSEEISYFLEHYLYSNKAEGLIYLRASTIYAGKLEFFKATAFSLLSEYLQKTDTLDNLINQAGLELSSTSNLIKDCLKKKNLSFLDVLEVINQFINETGRSCLLIIEEFLKLAKLFDDFYPNFSKFIILQRNCMIILAASDARGAQKVLSGELNLLFANFETIPLNRNNYLENYLYLKRLISPISPSPFFLSFFIKILGSSMAYYDFMAQAIKDKYSAEDEDGSLINITQTTLYLAQTYFFQKFIKKIDLLKANLKDFIPALKLLFALSDGYLRRDELNSLEIYDSKELNSRLQKIGDLNYIENLGNIYKLKDPLFSFWLANIFKLYFLSPVSDPQRRELLCRKRLEEAVGLFREQFFTDKVKKVLQLFSSFRNDHLLIGKNKYRLPTIRNTKTISYPKENFHIVIGEGPEIVFAGIKEKNVDDNDVLDFIEKGRSVKGKRVKKIFISLDRLPSTARLIAKNNKLIVWDVNEVNSLLNIYNKPAVSF